MSAPDVSPAQTWASAARAIYERELSRVGITGLHKAAIGDVLEGVRHVEALLARVESPPPAPELPMCICWGFLPDAECPEHGGASKGTTE